MNTIIAVDIGGTQLRVAVYPEDSSQPITQKRINTRGKGSPLERLSGLIQELWPSQGKVLAVSAGAPGQVDPAAGLIVSCPNIPGWKDLYFAQQMEQVFHVPIFLNNDANLAALGEWQYGAARGHQNVFYITVSTGIGGGVILHEQLLLGKHGLATEVGHVVIMPDGPLCGCGKRGHLESLASGTAIANYFNEEVAKGRQSSLAADPPPSAKEIAQAAQQGDALAQEAFRRAGYYMGIGLSNYLHLFNPSIVVIGGGVSRSGNLFWEPMRASVEEHVLAPKYLEDLTIVPAALGDDCGLLGALALARSELGK